MPKINPNGIHEWNGDPKVLPPMEELFIYKGQTYYWERCPCGNPECKRPTAYTEDGHKSRSMTLRVRGEDTGFIEITILLKIGATIEEIADAIDNEGDKGLKALLDRKMAEDPFEKGLITPEELNGLMQAAMIEASGLGSVLRMLGSLSGDGTNGPNLGNNPGGKIPPFMGRFSSN